MCDINLDNFEEIIINNNNPEITKIEGVEKFIFLITENSIPKFYTKNRKDAVEYIKNALNTYAFKDNWYYRYFTEYNDMKGYGEVTGMCKSNFISYEKKMLEFRIIPIPFLE